MKLDSSDLQKPPQQVNLSQGGRTEEGRDPILAIMAN